MVVLPKAAIKLEMRCRFCDGVLQDDGPGLVTCSSCGRELGTRAEIYRQAISALLYEIRGMKRRHAGNRKQLANS